MMWFLEKAILCLGLLRTLIPLGIGSKTISLLFWMMKKKDWRVKESLKENLEVIRLLRTKNEFKGESKKIYYKQHSYVNPMNFYFNIFCYTFIYNQVLNMRDNVLYIE